MITVNQAETIQAVVAAFVAAASLMYIAWLTFFLNLEPIDFEKNSLKFT